MNKENKMKKNRNKDGWVSISYNGGSSLEVRHVTAQCVKKAFDSEGIRYTGGNSSEVIKDNNSDRFMCFCRESYLAGSMMLLGMQFPVLRERQVQVVMFPKENK
jgi:hypothetical protein